MDKQHINQAISEIVQAAKPSITNRKPGFVVYDFRTQAPVQATGRKVS